MSLSDITNLIRLRAAGKSATAVPPNPLTADSSPSLLAREERLQRGAASPPTQAFERRTLLVGMDFGTDRARIAAVLPGVEEFYLRRSVLAVVARHQPEQANTAPEFAEERAPGWPEWVGEVEWCVLGGHGYARRVSVIHYK